MWKFKIKKSHVYTPFEDLNDSVDISRL